MSAKRRGVRFGEWVTWNDRSPLPARQGGLYLFGCFRSGRPGSAPNPSRPSPEVIYVGEAKNLNERPLKQHPYVQRYADLFGDRSLDRLYVAVAPLYRTDVDHVVYRVARLHAAYWEAKLIWRYGEEHGHPPVLHFGKDTPDAPWIAQEVAALKGRRT